MEEDEVHGSSSSLSLSRRRALQRDFARPNRPNSVTDCSYSSSLVIYHNNHGKGGSVPRKPGHSSSEVMDSLTSGPGPMSFDDESQMTSFNTRYSDMNPGAGRHFVEPLSQARTTERVEVMRNPERVYKVIFIGDSSVGKTSLITRFSSGRFTPGMKSTIGVDFHTKSLLIDQQSVCLQCWDTAGQERYRSITRQYFRKVAYLRIGYCSTCPSYQPNLNFSRLTRWSLCTTSLRKRPS